MPAPFGSEGKNGRMESGVGVGPAVADNDRGRSRKKFVGLTSGV